MVYRFIVLWVYKLIRLHVYGFAFMGWVGFGLVGLGWAGLGWAGIPFFNDAVWSLDHLCSRLFTAFKKHDALEMFLDFCFIFGPKNHWVLRPGHFSVISGRYRSAG